jgi:hypothetical protein
MDYEGPRVYEETPAFIQSYMDIDNIPRQAAVIRDEGIQFSKLLSGSSQAALMVTIIIVGVIYMVHGTAPAELIEFAKWVIGGTSATSLAYMIKSGVENKAKLEHPESAICDKTESEAKTQIRIAEQNHYSSKIRGDI